MSNSRPVYKFPKGESGNPNGRPKAEWTWKGEILKALERATPDGVPMKEGVANALIDKALEGDVQAIREIGNRTDGMPIQKNILAGDDDHPFRIDIHATLKKVYGITGSGSTGEMPTDR